MAKHKAGALLNLGMIVAFAFSLVISFLAVKGLLAYLGCQEGF